MIPEHDAEQRTAHLPRRVLGSIVSGIIALSALTLLGAAYGLIQPRGGYLQLPWWIVPAIAATYSAPFVFSTWLIILLPLYLMVPRPSLLSRWPLCTLCGAIAGATIMFAFYSLYHPLNGSGMFFAAALSGATTSLVGSLLSHRFCHVSNATTVA